MNFEDLAKKKVTRSAPATGQWVIANNSTGAFAITAKTTAAAGTSTVLPQGSAVIVYSDGTNMFFASSGGQTSLTRTQFSLVAGTTSLTVATGYTAGNIFIEKNGLLLEPTAFTAIDGSTITPATATVANDVINVYAFKTFNVANAVLKSGDTMNGPLVLHGGDTGTTAAAGDNTTKLSTTAFVHTALAGHLTPASVAADTEAGGTAGAFATTGSTSTVSVTDPGASGANIALHGNGVNPSKFIRAANGNLDFVNSAYTAVIASISDAGTFSAGGLIAGGNGIVSNNTINVAAGGITVPGIDIGHAFAGAMSAPIITGSTQIASPRFTGMGTADAIYAAGTSRNVLIRTNGQLNSATQVLCPQECVPLRPCSRSFRR